MSAPGVPDKGLGAYELLLIHGPLLGLAGLLAVSAVLGYRLVFALGAQVLPFVPSLALYTMFALLEDTIREESHTWVPLKASTRREILASWCAVVVGVVALAGLEFIVTPSFPILPIMAIAGVAGASIPVLLWIDGGRRRALFQEARRETNQSECFVNENAGSTWIFAGLMWFGTFFALTWPIGVTAGLQGIVTPSDLASSLLLAVYGLAFGFLAGAFTMAGLLGSEIRPNVVGFRILNPNGLWPLTLEIKPHRVARCFETTVSAFGTRKIRIEMQDGTQLDFDATALEKYESANGLSFPAWMLSSLGEAENSISLARAD